jgi:hypothetical protein
MYDLVICAGGLVQTEGSEWWSLLLVCLGRGGGGGRCGREEDEFGNGPKYWPLLLKYLKWGLWHL